MCISLPLSLHGRLLLRGSRNESQRIRRNPFASFLSPLRPILPLSVFLSHSPSRHLDSVLSLFPCPKSLPLVSSLLRFLPRFSHFSHAVSPLCIVLSSLFCLLFTLIRKSRLCVYVREVPSRHATGSTAPTMGSGRRRAAPPAIPPAAAPPTPAATVSATATAAAAMVARPERAREERKQRVDGCRE